MALKPKANGNYWWRPDKSSEWTPVRIVGQWIYFLYYDEPNLKHREFLKDIDGEWGEAINGSKKKDGK